MKKLISISGILQQCPLLLIACCVFTSTAFGQVGAIDATFNPSDLGFKNGDGPSNGVYSVVLQSDGKILIGGDFTTYNGTSRSRIARLNSNGSLDTAFHSGTGADSVIYSIMLQSDGKILIGGKFSSYNGTSRNHIARLNSDGSLDTGFNPGTGASAGVYSIALQSDQKILIGGVFSTYNGTSRRGIARLNSNGSVDTAFHSGTGTDSVIYSVALQSDGKILIGGKFTFYNGTARNHIARLNLNGSLDTGFNPGKGANTAVYSIALQSDQKILIGGDFSTYNGTSRNHIARLNLDGSLDTSFDPSAGANATVSSIAVQSDGKILIGGDFNSYNGISRKGIARLNANGSLDAGLNPGTGAGGSTKRINSMVFQGDGKILIGGLFNTYNGTSRNYITLLNSDGSLDIGFNPGTGANNTVNSVVLQSDGKILIAGAFTIYNGTLRNSIARLNSDGSLDTGFNPGTGADNTIYSIAVQNDGKILLGGYFTTYNGIARNNIVRLNSDGSLDTDFNPGTGVDGSLNSLVLQGDGKILIGGAFTTYNGISRNSIARLNSDGTLDSNFNPGTGASAQINIIALQSDGKILLGGAFIKYNGISRKYIARINADGSLDTGFNPGTGANIGGVYSIALQMDGKILIGGLFTSYNGTTKNHIARLNSDGSLDNGFNTGTGADNMVYSITLEGDDKILIGGFFTSYNGTSRMSIARLNSDGSLDTFFDPGKGASAQVTSIALQSDEKILIGGGFAAYNGTGRNRIARILNSSISSSVTGTSFCRKSSISIAYTATGTFNAGNVFTALLSDASGSFASPVPIGTLTSTVSGTISATIPSGTIAGTGYRIRVGSNNGTIGTDNGSNLIINAVNATVNQSGNTLTANAVGANYQWLDCGKGNSKIVGETGQSFTASTPGNYAVMVTENSCSDTSACINLMVTAIAENAKTNLSVYPNPNTGSFIIKANAEGNYSIINNLGQVIRVVELSSAQGYTSSIQDLDKGIYFLVSNDKKLLRQKIVVLR